MTALILAAGFGSRLMPLTSNRPKCLVPYLDKPILDYEVEALRAAGVQDIALVGGYLVNELIAHAKTLGIHTIFENPNYDSTNMVATLFCARKLLEQLCERGEGLIVSYADIVYEPSIVRALMHCEGELRIVVDRAWQKLWQRRFENPLDDAETLRCDGDNLLELGKKPETLDEIEGQYIGLFAFGASFLREVIATYDSLDKSAFYDNQNFRNMYMTSFLQCLIDRYHNAKAVFIDGGWCEIDSKSDLEIDWRNL